jgi:hypothetical protein
MSAKANTPSQSRPKQPVARKTKKTPKPLIQARGVDEHSKPNVVMLPAKLGGGEAYRARELNESERLDIPLGLNPMDEFTKAIRAVLGEWFGDVTGETKFKLSLESREERCKAGFSVALYSDAGDWLHFINVVGFRIRGNADVYLPGPIPKDSRIAREEAELTREAGRPKVICPIVRATEEGITVTRHVDDLDDDELEAIGLKPLEAPSKPKGETYLGIPVENEFIVALRDVLDKWFGVDLDALPVRPGSADLTMHVEASREDDCSITLSIPYADGTWNHVTLLFDRFGVVGGLDFTTRVGQIVDSRYHRLREILDEGEGYETDPSLIVEAKLLNSPRYTVRMVWGDEPEVA